MLGQACRVALCSGQLSVSKQEALFTKKLPTGGVFRAAKLVLDMRAKGLSITQPRPEIDGKPATYALKLSTNMRVRRPH
jgi:hypothetical protein